MNMQLSRGRSGTLAILTGAALALTLCAGSALAQGELPKLFLPAVAPEGATPFKQSIACLLYTSRRG